MKKNIRNHFLTVIALILVLALTACDGPSSPVSGEADETMAITETETVTEPVSEEVTTEVPAESTSEPMQRPVNTAIQNRYDSFVPNTITVNNSDYVIPEEDCMDLIGVTNYGHYAYYDTAFYVLDLGSQMSFGYNADRYFSPGCTRKAGFALAWFKELEANRIKNEQGVPLSAGENRLVLESLYYYDGTDYLAGAGKVGRGGYRWYTVQELLYHLIHESDNTAYKALWNLMGTAKYNAIALRLGIPEHPDEYKRDKLWTPMRPLDLGLIWQEIWEYKQTDTPESQAFWRFLTNNLYCEIGKVVEGADEIAHKAGSDDYGFHEAGIVIRGEDAYVVVAMSTVPLPIAYDDYDCIHMVIERIDPIMQEFYAWQDTQEFAEMETTEEP